MKKFLFILGFICGFGSLVHSEGLSRIFTRPGTWTREAVGISSYTAAATINVTISTQPAIDLLKVVVTNPGTSSFVDLYDGRVSTSAAGIRYLGRFDTTSKHEWNYTVGISSGLMVHNAGTTPAGVAIIYREHDFR